MLLLACQSMFVQVKHKFNARLAGTDLIIFDASPVRDFLPIGQDVPLVTFFGAKRHSQYLLADLWCEIVIIKIWWEIIT